MPTSIPTRILVAPSGFKESLSPEGVCQAVAAGVRRLLPGAVVVELPLVDGGEGSAATMARATGGDLVTTRVTGPVGEPVEDRQAQAEFPQHRMPLVHCGPERGGVAVAQCCDRRLRERAESVDERADGRGVGLVALAQSADGLPGAAVDSRIGDDEVRATNALAEEPHLTALEPYRRRGAGGCRIQPGWSPVRDLLGQLREREQLISGGGALAGVQDRADDRPRCRGRRSQPALVGEVAVGGDLKALTGTPRELPGCVERAHDAREL